MENYYIRRNGKVIGPTPLDNIRKLYQGGKIKDTDEISSDQSRWTTLARFFQSQEEDDAEVAEVAEEAEEVEDEPAHQEDSAVNIASKKQEKAMWSVTWFLGVGAAVLFFLGIALGFVFGFYPEIGNVIPNLGNENQPNFGGFRK